MKFFPLLLLLSCEVEATLRGALREARFLQEATYKGNNLNIQLNLCEGDCDSDDDCVDGLVCYQRTPGQPIPGCRASDHALNGETDFCVLPSDGDSAAANGRSNSGGGSTSSSSSNQVSIMGNDGSPSSAFPLGLCQGDCDSDSDCQGGLVCFQRGANEDVPGCDGGLADSTTNDYCIERSARGGYDDGDDADDDDSSGSSGGTSGGSFYLKMYWEDGYHWQSEHFERKWCLRCYGSKCNEGDPVIIVPCDESPTKLNLINYGSEFQFQISGQDLCFELQSDNQILLESCSSSNSEQRWEAQNGSPSGTRFEIINNNKPGFCVTQRHEPKDGEAIHVETCETARKSDTSYWTVV